MEDIVRVEVAEPPMMNTLVGLNVVVRPGELDDSVTVPVNPLIAVTVIVDVVVVPASMFRVVGLAVSAKSVTTKVTAAE